MTSDSPSSGGFDGDSGQYFAEEPAVHSAPATVTLSLPDLTVELQTDRGVFSADQIDLGTRILLAEIPPLAPTATDVVDIGCGYGPVAVTLASRAPWVTVHAVDTNRRARELCQANATALGLDNIEVHAPADVPDDLTVDTIYSNPPIRIGKTALHDLLDGWLDRLRFEGTAYLVVQKHLGADSLATHLRQRSWRVERLRSRRAYRVLEVCRSNNPATNSSHQNRAPRDSQETRS